MTEKILDLETRIQILVEDSNNKRAVDTALDASSSRSPVHCSVAELEPMQQGNWVIARRPSRGQNTAFPFRSEQQTGSPHSVTHQLRNLMKVLKLLTILLYGT